MSDLNKKYSRFDDDHKEVKCTLFEMIRHEPEWVKSRFEFMEGRIKELEKELDFSREWIEQTCRTQKIHATPSTIVGSNPDWTLIIMPGGE